MASEKKQSPRDSEEARRAKEEQARRGRRRSRQLMGAALAVLIVVGAVSIVRSGVDLVRGMLDTTSETDTYNDRLAPLVWFDPLPFESLSEADPIIIKEAVIWGTLNQLGYANVDRSELGEALVPAIEVDRYAAALFGPDFQFDHETFKDEYQSMEYIYNAETAMYLIPATGLNPEYLVNVVEITNLEGGIKRVTAGYVSTRGAADELIATPDLEHPAKYMDYFFRRDGSEHYLYAMRSNTTYVPATQEGSSSVAASQSASSSLPEDSAIVDSSSATRSSQPADSLPAEEGTAPSGGDEAEPESLSQSTASNTEMN